MTKIFKIRPLVAFWLAVDGNDEKAAIAAIQAGAEVSATRRPESPQNQRVEPDTPASVAVDRSWTDLLRTLLAAGLDPRSTTTPQSASLSLLGRAVFRANAPAMDLLMEGGADPHRLEGRGAAQENLWHILARASRDSSPEAIRAVADRLIGAGVALKVPGTGERAPDGVISAWLRAALRRPLHPEYLQRTQAMLDVLMDPKYGWDWGNRWVRSELRDMPDIHAAVEARLLARRVPEGPAVQASPRLRL